MWKDNFYSTWRDIYQGQNYKTNSAVEEEKEEAVSLQLARDVLIYRGKREGESA